MKPRDYAALLSQIGSIRVASEALGVTRATLYARTQPQGAGATREAVLAAQQVLSEADPLTFRPGEAPGTSGQYLVAFLSPQWDIHVAGVATVELVGGKPALRLPGGELAPLPVGATFIRLSDSTLFRSALLTK